LHNNFTEKKIGHFKQNVFAKTEMLTKQPGKFLMLDNQFAIYNCLKAYCQYKNLQTSLLHKGQRDSGDEE
jgi:hypothetical protein